MRRIRTAFITGCLVLGPTALTLYILVWFIRSVDTLARKLFPTTYIPFDFTGLGLILALGIIVLTGLLTQNFIGKWFIRLFDRIIAKVSVVGGLYGGIKKFLEMLLNPTNDQFRGAVLVPFPCPGIYSVGFRTGQPDKKLAKAGKNLQNVFVPLTPNPTSGFYLLVPEEELIALDLSVQEAFKIILSMGLVTDENTITPP